MQANPLEEWQRLSELYREKNEEELRELANDFTDLTETAQQVLRDEMRKRSMGDPGAPHVAQLVEQLIRNQQVASSSLAVGSTSFLRSSAIQLLKYAHGVR